MGKCSNEIPYILIEIQRMIVKRQNKTKQDKFKKQTNRNNTEIVKPKPHLI